MTSRRDFLKAGLIGASGVAASTLFSACSTLDEFIFEDQFDLKDQILIIGGGISGLYLAYKLRQTKSEYRLHEGSSYLGGRIRSYQGLDFGASVYQNSDELMRKLIKDFKLQTMPFNKDSFSLVGGSEVLTQAMLQRILGLMPYRTLRMRWKLTALYKFNGRYEAVFETPNGRRVVFAKKIALTIPPSQWGSVDGLLKLPEMEWAKNWLQSLQPTTILKAHMTSSAGLLNNMVQPYLNKKSLLTNANENSSLSVVGRILKPNSPILEFEYEYSQKMNTENYKINAHESIEIEKLFDLIAAKTKNNLSVKKIADEFIFDWSSIELIQSAYFKNKIPFPEAAKRNSTFQVFGDYSSSVKPHTVEGALQEALRVSSVFV